MEYNIVVNGLGHAFLREFGCPCERCRDLSHVANTSVSVIATDTAGDVTWHALVDCGLGVVTSLCNTFAPEETRLDWLLFTHWHSDHSLELNRLCETLQRLARVRGVPFTHIPTWCRSGSAQWLQKRYSYEWYRCLKPVISDTGEMPGTVLNPLPLNTKEITITPVSVSHCSADIDPATFKDRVFCSACFVIETNGRKAVLLWDLDKFNEWIVDPVRDEERKAYKLLRGTDYLFIDCFNWTVEAAAGRNTGHISFATVKRYANTLAPSKTLLMHMSGHEGGEKSPGWGWSNRQWEEESQKVWTREALPGVVKVPEIGETFAL